jgi:hypothetical protein
MRETLLQAVRTVASDRHKLITLLGGFSTDKTTLLSHATPVALLRYAILQSGNQYLTAFLGSNNGYDVRS